jgi:uncharacterized repeat protein (TIGR03803 family)
MCIGKFWSRLGVASALCVLLFTGVHSVEASQFKVLHTFKGGPDGTNPFADITLDRSGNLYGTTTTGGDTAYCSNSGCGTVFRLRHNPDGSWSKKVLYAFKGVPDGSAPQAKLTLDSNGNLYGTTAYGGLINSSCPLGCGVVFKLTRNQGGTWAQSVLYTFTGLSDGGSPLANVIFDSSGDLYGTTVTGGDLSTCFGFGCGVVFQLVPNPDGSWTPNILYRFSGGPDGGVPRQGLVLDAAGIVYGSTTNGGDPNCISAQGCGVVFQLTHQMDGSWKYAVLHAFHQQDGAYPVGNLTLDSAGVLYGATDVADAGVNGLVFKLTPNQDGTWTETVLHRFTSPQDAAFPFAGVVLDKSGNLYGTTANGGDLSCGDGYGCGAVYRMSLNPDGSWSEHVLHRFEGTPGANPYNASVVIDDAGNIYGDTSNCGATCAGSVYQLIP